MVLDRQQLSDYKNWIGQTPWDVHLSIIRAGGWQSVFPGPLPRWASKIRQYFNLSPMSLTLLDSTQSLPYLKSAQKAIPASAHAKARRNELQSRGMGISFYAPGSSAKPGTLLTKPDPRAAIDSLGGEIGTMFALSGHVYEDNLGRSIWFQMVPGATLYHLGIEVTSPTRQALELTYIGQEGIALFKLVSPDGTGGSRECCVTNPARRGTIGNVGEEVDLAGRYVTDSVNQGSYNYAETVEKGLPEHQRLDVNTDPMLKDYFVVPPNLFRFAELYMREFPANDRQGKPLAAQAGKAP